MSKDRRNASYEEGPFTTRESSYETKEETNRQEGPRAPKDEATNATNGPSSM